MKIATVVGARPQFIKAATVSRVLAVTPGCREVLIHTGQHHDPNMSDVFFQEMEIPHPKHHLGVSGLSHGAMTGRMLEGLEKILIDEKPDVVLVYGDTNSTLAGALAAAKLNIPVAHVEAGLRSFRQGMPEEINRVLTDRISKWLFCPTVVAMSHLQNEGIEKDPARQAYLVGDVMYDAALFYSPRSRVPSGVPERFALATIHRAENVDDPTRLKEILEGLRAVSKNIMVVLPIHPRTRHRIELEGFSTKGVRLMNPVGYFEMLGLLQNCELVLTDSGGLQKEAYFFSKPCLTLRDETEWSELVEVGQNVLVGASATRIEKEVARLSTPKRKQREGLYGDGFAAKQIVDYLIKGR